MKPETTALIARVFGYTYQKEKLLPAKKIQRLLEYAHVNADISDIELVRRTLETVMKNPAWMGSPPFSEDSMRTIEGVARSILTNRPIRPGKSDSETQIIRMITEARKVVNFSPKDTPTPEQTEREITPAEVVKIFLKNSHSDDPNVKRLIAHLKRIDAARNPRSAWEIKMNKYLTRFGMWNDVLAGMERVNEANREAQQNRRMVESERLRKGGGGGFNPPEQRRYRQPPSHLRRKMYGR